MLLLCSAAFATTRDIQTDFSAGCDGADDRAEIQAALDGTASGDILNFSCTASLSAGVNISGRSDITIQGTSGGGVKALAEMAQGNGGFSAVMFLVSSCSSCTIRNMTFDGNGFAAGFGVNNTTSTTVQGNTVNRVGYPATAALSSVHGHNNLYIGNTIYITGKDSDTTDATRGMWIGNGQDLFSTQLEYYPTITQNNIQRSSGSAIVVHAVGAIVSDNYASTLNDGAGVKAVPTGSGSAITYITGNTFDDTGAQGVQLENADTAGIIIQNNDLKNQPQSGVLISGASGTNRIQIIGNTFTDNDQAGITLINASSITIDRNRFIAGPGPITQGIGVDFQGPYGVNDTVAVTNNYISTNSDGGIAIYHDIGSGALNKNITINGNSVINSQYFGIWIDDHGENGTTNITLGTNCFSNNDDGNISDSRGILAEQDSSASCPDPTQNQSIRQIKGAVRLKGRARIK